MPSYDFRCNACGRRFVLTYKTYAEYDAARHTCPHCGSSELTRLISRVAIAKSARWGAGSGDDPAFLDELEHNDPRALGRMLREITEETGEDLGPEFDEVVTRLERGEDPEKIEADLPDAPADLPATDMGDATGGDL